MLNIMYHFVGRKKALKGISIKTFQTQLDILCKKYNKTDLTITFDHGTADHIEHVAPELEIRGLKGTFFILTMAPEELQVPLVDKQRHLESLYRLDLAKMLCLELGISYKPAEAKNYLSMYKFYSIEERYLRYLRDEKISPTDYQAFIDDFFVKTFGDEEKFTLKEYLNWEQIIDLHRRGHIIGSHSHYHVGDKNDFAKSINIIEEKINEEVTCVSYPNGVKKLSDDDLIKLHIKTAYISSENGSSPFREERVDCAQLML